MSRRKDPRTSVAWVGIVVRTEDGSVHAMELLAGPGNYVTADLNLDRNRFDVNADFNIAAVVKGRGRYWREGENFASNARVIGQHAIERERAGRQIVIPNPPAKAIEGVIGDGK